MIDFDDRLIAPLFHFVTARRRLTAEHDMGDNDRMSDKILGEIFNCELHLIGRIRPFQVWNIAHKSHPQQNSLDAYFT